MFSKIEQKKDNLNTILSLYISSIKNTRGKKNCSQMGEENGVVHDKLQQAQNFLSKKLSYVKSLLLSHGISAIRQKIGWLVIDTTHLSKRYSKQMEGVSLGYNGASGKVERGLTLIVIMWTNGFIKIPLASKICLAKSLTGDNHIKITDLALKLIIPIAQKIGCLKVLADGAFASAAFIKTLDEHGIVYIMRFASNRIIYDSFGNKRSIKEFEGFKFDRNARVISIKTTWHDIPVYITASRQRTKYNVWEYRYLISNQSHEKIDHIKSYDQRWAIEVFFRSTKQQFGLSDCLSRSLDNQEAHVTAVFLAFIEKETEKPSISSPVVKKTFKLRNIPIYHRSKASSRSGVQAYA